MAARANYVKLGLFVVIGIAVALVLAITAGALKLRTETVANVTYFAESVEGLAVGAPVKARGVQVGRVGDITFAPDHEMIEVRMDMDVATIRAMGMNPAHVRPEVRTQLASSGLLGPRFIALDVFDPAKYPAPPLKFTPPERYVPSTPSIQKSLEASLDKVLDRSAVLMDTFVREGVADKTARALTDFDTLVLDLDNTLRQLDGEKLPARTAKAVDEVRVTIGKLNQALDNENGLLAAAQRALASVGEAGKSASAGTRDLQGVLDELRAAAIAIRELVEKIEQNPDMLLKGRKKP